MADQLDDRESDFSIVQNTETVVFRPNHQLMARPRLRERDMLPQRVFFYRRLTDQALMVFTEQEAALMLKSSHGPVLQQIGVSDGTAYSKFIRECGIRSGERVTKEKAEEVLRGAMQAELEAATGHFAKPLDQNVHFDESFPLEHRSGFVPPA